MAKVLSLQFVFAPQLHPIPATMALNFVLPSATAAPATAVTASPATFARPAATATTSTSSQTATLGAVAAVAGLAMRKRNRSKERNGDLVRRPEENGWIWMDLVRVMEYCIYSCTVYNSVMMCYVLLYNIVE